MNHFYRLHFTIKIKAARVSKMSTTIGHLDFAPNSTFVVTLSVSEVIFGNVLRPRIMDSLVL